MPVRLLSFLAVVGLVALPAPVRAAEAEQPAPALIVRIQSIDGLLADAEYLAGLAGHKEQAKQMQGMLKAKVGKQGLQGIDTTRPLGLYGTVGAQGIDSTAAVLIPIKDEDAFLKLLESLNVKPEKGDDGVYTVTPEQLPLPIYFRFAHKYAYVTVRDKSAIEKDKLIEPSKILPPGGTGTLSISLRFDLIPEGIKQLALGQMELKLADAKEQKEPGETEAQHKFKEAILDDVSRQVTALLKDGRELSLRIDVDRKAEEISLELGLSATPSSPLAKTIADVGQGKSLFANLLTANAAMKGVVLCALSDEVRKAMGPMIDEGLRKLLDKEQDPLKRAQGELFKALAPTFKAGQLDAAFSVLGPGKSGHYAFLAGLKVKDGKAIDQAIRDATKELPEKDKAKVKLDAETADDIKIHRAEIGKDMDEKQRQVFGEGPLYTAVRSDAWFFAFGDGGLDALKAALSAKPGTTLPFQLDIAMARLAPAMAKGESKNAEKVAEEVFGKAGPQGDRIHVTVEGGKAARLRVSVKAPVVTFASKLGQGVQAQFKPVTPKEKKPDDQ
jgi:hypothetical protein